MIILYQNTVSAIDFWRKTLRAMKLIALFTFAVIIQLHAEVHSQSFNFNEPNTTVKQMFKQIEKNSKYSIFYRLDQVNLNQKINVVTTQASIEMVMAQVLKNQPLTFEVVDEVVVIKINEANGSLKDIIKGQVVDSKGQSLPGVSIKVKGSATGTSTDANGNFSSDFPANSVLVFSYIGFITQEIPVNGRTTINVTLLEDSQALSEVVVTALGISKDKKALSYGVTEVKGDSFTQARENNLGNALSGKIAGVNASSTSTGPGGSSRVVIRGNGSLSSDNQPLYVVNGVPINNTNNSTPGTFGGRDGGDGLISINPDDIETLSVLKGGAAAALYGSRAAAGVILITTKSGKGQQGLGVEYNSTYTMEKVMTIPDWQYEYGQGSLGLKATNAASAVSLGRLSWGPKLDGSSVVQFDGVSRPYVAQQDNNKNFYNTGATFSNTLALTGGNENANFRFSVSDLDNAGIIPNSEIKRNTFNLNASANISKKIIFEGNAQYNVEVNKNRTNIGDFTYNPNASVGVMATSLDVRTLDPGYNPTTLREIQWADDPFVANPYFAVNRHQNEDQRRRIIGSFRTRWNITDHLYARAGAGVDYYNRENWQIVPTGALTNLAGTYGKGKRIGFETNLEALLGYDNTFGKFSVSAFVGGNKMYTRRTINDLASGDLNVPYNYFIANGKSQTFTDEFTESAINSVFASSDIGFNSYLYLTLTARQDWFSTLSPTSNSILYPSAGLSFVLSEVWGSKPSWLDYAKVRGSWAQVGGGEPSPYGLDLAYVAGAVTHLGQPLMTINGNTIPNPLKPFTSTTTEVGVETRMFKSRVGVDLTLYDKVTTDDIVSASIPNTTGYQNVRLNVGEMRNRGVELLLTGTPIQSSTGFSWDASFNMAYNDNKVVKIAPGLTSLAGGQPRTQNAFVNHYEGKPFGMVSGYRMRTDANGNIVYNASGIPMQSTSIVDLGRGVPPLTIGLSNTFRYKNLSLGFLMDGKFGGVLYTSTNAYGTNYGLDKRTVEGGVRENGVQVTGVDASGAPFSRNVAAQTYYQGIAFSITDQFVSDADFIKLRQLTLGYTLPKALIAKTPLQSVGLSLVARNLFMVYNQVKNVDPESSYSIAGTSFGLENFGVPQTRSFGLNLLVKF